MPVNYPGFHLLLPVMKALFCSILLPLFIYGPPAYSAEPARGGPSAARTPINPEDLVIEVKGNSREVAYTNKEAGVFYTETNGEHRSAWQGWRVMSREVMEDYALEIGGVELRRSDVVRALVYPHQLVREYANGVRETVTLLDGVNASLVELDSVTGSDIAIRPLFSDLRRQEDFTLDASGGILSIGRKDYGTSPAQTQYPGWISLTLEPQTGYALAFYEGKQYGTHYSPAALRSGIRSVHYTVVITAGNSNRAASRLALSIIDRYPDTNPVVPRRDRIARLLNRSYFRSDNPRLDKALSWATVSLDALIMNQNKKGIFAGLPWFDDYWGSDSFISLPGATLVTGDFADAKSILRSFSEWQDTAQSSSTFGRIPNTVTTSSMSYNSADGTPRFVSALWQYLLYSGDTDLVRELFPAVKRSIEGTLKYHVDRDYFLTHGDAETWMDAVGPQGAWAARGNRANDIQALWHDQLRDAASIAGQLGDNKNHSRWNQISEILSSNFNKRFVDTTAGLIYDFLHVDGTPDRRVRPNQLFGDELIRDEQLQRRVFLNVTKMLVYPHGVATLSQTDDDFHPYHHYPPNYVPDEAYHNGIVWPWLAGRWIDEAARYGLSDSAFAVTENMVHLLLERGAVGTLSELLDAAPRQGEQEPRLSGAFSQAWSLAEFIRSFYQAYLGVAVNAANSKLLLRPRLPLAIKRADFDVVIGTGVVTVGYERAGGDFKVSLSSPPGGKTYDVVVLSPPDPRPRVCDLKLPPGGHVDVVIGKDCTSRLSDSIAPRVWNPREVPGVLLATPTVRANLKALRPPPYRMLTVQDIKVSDPSAKTLYDIADPAGDDTATYSYPLTPYLKPGSLDITHFTVSADAKNAYFRLKFRELSDPGWHPEYGFQLTYAAIAIDKDGKSGSGETRVGMNAQFTLKREFAYESVIYVGGGIRVQDSKGKILSEYVPAPGDEKNPLGDAETKTIAFALPIEIVGKPEPSWRYTVLIGAQDDHGGAGIGEFRSVEGKAKEWTGGGKRKPGDPNVYDYVLPPKSK